MCTEELMRREIKWYQQHGRFPDERIKNGYVIGDFSWNRLHPDKREIIEPQMERAIGRLSTEPDDSDVEYCDNWEEAEARAKRMVENARRIRLVDLEYQLEKSIEIAKQRKGNYDH